LDIDPARWHEQHSEHLCDDGDWAALKVAAGGRPIEGLLGCSIFSCFVLFSKKRMMVGLDGSP